MAQKPVENAKNEEEAAPKPLKMQVLAQYIRDMSFENILAQKGISGEAQPDVSVQVNIDAKKRPIENQFEVIIKTEISSKTKDKGEAMFLLELEYAYSSSNKNIASPLSLVLDEISVLMMTSNWFSIGRFFASILTCTDTSGCASPLMPF